MFLMQAGFALLEAGTVQNKNRKNILLKNVLDPCFSAFGFWAVGYAFAYGPDGNAFMGWSNWALMGEFEAIDTYQGFFFQLVFSATCATIVSGSVAERCKLVAFFGYSGFLCAFVYPLVAHWIWAGDGFLSAFNEDPLGGVGVIDFAGSGVVHMTGGMSAFYAAYVLGPRIGRFNKDGSVNAQPGSDFPMMVFGTFILWFGWYGFNPGSTLGIQGYAFIAGKSAVTTTLSAAGGGISIALHTKYKTDCWEVGECCNGILAGLVGITAGCSVVEPWAALVIGIISGQVYALGDWSMKKMLIDDPLNAVAVHGFCGIWGLLAVGLFASDKMMKETYGITEHAGVFYTGQFMLLGIQLIGFLCIAAWVSVTMFPFFLTMRAMDLFRVDVNSEVGGLDNAEMGGSTYGIGGDGSEGGHSTYSLNKSGDVGEVKNDTDDEDFDDEDRPSDALNTSDTSML